MEGQLVTTTVEVAVLVQPLTPVTVTVYVVETSGETVMAAVLAPVFHK
jgi:hypothetical protein